MASIGLLACLAALFPQGEKIPLRWKFREGEALKASWKMRLKVAIVAGESRVTAVDADVEVAGTLRCGKAEGDGPAEFRLDVERYLLKGTQQGREMDILIEEGEVRRDTGLKANPRDIIGVPVRLKATSRGMFEPDRDHPAAGFLGGKGVSFGPRLPEVPVAPGDAWTFPMQTSQARARNGPEFQVTARWKGMADCGGRRCAHIVVDDRATLEQDEMDVEFRVTGESFFDPERGRVLKSEISTDGTGKGERSGQAFSVEMTGRILFELTPTE